MTEKIIRFDVAMILKYVFYLILLWMIVFLFREVSCDNDHGYVPPEVIESLHEAGFVKPGNDPGLHKPLGEHAGVKPVVSGTGIAVVETGQAWPDTLPIEVGVVIDPAGNPWVGVWANGNPVEWIEAPQVDWPSNDLKNSDWIFMVGASPVGNSMDWGLGLAWTPLHRWEINFGLAATVDGGLVSNSAEWASIGLYVDKKISILRIGGNIGYRFGLESGLSAGISAGIGLDF